MDIPADVTESRPDTMYRLNLSTAQLQRLTVSVAGARLTQLGVSFNRRYSDYSTSNATVCDSFRTHAGGLYGVRILYM